MKQTRRYNNLKLTPQQRDDEAIEDVKFYLGQEKWSSLLILVDNRAYSVGELVQQISMFLGIKGYPLHALMRRYRLEDYKTWMAEGGYRTTATGFPIYSTDKE